MSGGFGSQGPSWGTLGKSMGYPMKAGGGKVGGLSNLPVVYRQVGGPPAALPVQPLPSRLPLKRNPRLEELRNQLEEAKKANDPEKIQSIQERLEIEKGSPAGRRGRIPQVAEIGRGAVSQAYKNRLKAAEALRSQVTSSAGKIGTAEEKGIADQEKILKEAARLRGVSRTDLEKQLKGVKRMGPGIRGISKATGTRKSPVQSFLEIADTTFEGAKKFSGEEAARKEALIKALSKLESEDREKGIGEQVATSKQRAASEVAKVTKVEEAEKTYTTESYAAYQKGLDKDNKIRMDSIVKEYALQDEIEKWPSEVRNKLLALDKEKLGNEKTRAEIEKLKAEARSAKSKVKIPKLTEPVRKAMELASLKDLGYSAVYNKDGELVSISGEEELSTDEVKILAQYERDFLERYAILIDQGKSEPTALSKARTYAGQQHLKRKKKISPAAAAGTPPPAAGTPPPAAGGNIQGLITLPP